MSLGKFISLLEKSALFFISGRALSDKYEGALPQQFARAIEPHIRDTDAQQIQAAINFDTAVNCWHMNSAESDSMWRSYLPGNAEGVAIRSTFQRLGDSFNATQRDVYIGVVRYIDYDTEDFKPSVLNTFVAMLHKSKAYDSERELRAIISTLNIVDTSPSELDRQLISNLDKGLHVPVVLDTLIQEIYLPPWTEPWFAEVITALLTKYSLSKEVKSSKVKIRTTHD